MKKSLLFAVVAMAALIVSCASGGGGATAAPVDASAMQTVVELAAKDATLTGTLQYETGADRDNIGYWTDEAATASWKFKLAEAGKYTIVVSYGVDDDHAGSINTITIGDQTLEYFSKSSGNWGVWRELVVGQMELKAGEYTLVAKAKKIANKYNTNLHAVLIKK